MPTMSDFKNKTADKTKSATKSAKGRAVKTAVKTTAKSKTPAKKITTKSKPTLTEMSSQSPAEQLRFEAAGSVPAPKRRPGRDQYETKKEDVKMMQANAQSESETKSIDEQTKASFEADAEETSQGPKVEINFKGSELLRSRFPQPFNVAEAVATEWMKDGSTFENLPINQPLAQWATQQSLIKAKELEKKVMESPAVEKAAMQALTLGMKAQTLVTQLRERLRK